MNTYFMVHLQGTSTNKVHNSYLEAILEARRLATLHPGKPFQVLQAVSSVEVKQPEPTITRLSSGD